MQRLILFLSFFTGILASAYTQTERLPLVPLQTYSEHRGEIESLVISPDGSTLLTGDQYGTLIFWKLPEMSMIYKVRAHTACINAILFNPKGTKFVTCGDDGKIRLWNFEKRLVMNSYATPYGRVNFAVLSPDERWIYFGGYRMNDDVNAADQDFTGLYKVSVSDNTYMEQLYDDDEVMSYYGTNWGITDGNIDPTGKYIVFTKGYDLLVWNIAANKLAEKIKSPYNLNNVTPLTNAIYAWGEGRIVKWTRSNGTSTLSRSLTAGNTEDGYSRIIFSSTGTQFITGDDGALVNIWNTGTLSRTQVLSGHTASVRAFSFYKNDSLLITGGYDGKVIIWGPPPKEEPPKDTIVEVKDTVQQVILPVHKDTVDTVVKRPVEVVFTENNIPVSIRDRPVEKAGTFYVKNEEFEIEIWDNSVYDHDIISLNINGEWVLENYEVTKEKHRLKIRVKPNTNNYLILYAQNLGEISPNTAAVGLVVDGKLQRLTVSSDLKHCGALNFEYKPE